MTLLQYAFLIVLSGALLGVALFSTVTVRAALERRGSALTDSWLARLGTAARPNDHAWAFLAHRISGIAIFAFLAVHVLDVSVYAFSSSAFDEIHRLYGTSAMRVFECLLLYAVLFHALNGVRLLILDVTSLGAGSARGLLRVALGVSVILGSTGSVVVLYPVFA